MAFGGSGFPFGNNNTNNNNNQSTGFGGFGANNNNNTGFGASTTNTGFGASTTGTNPFGGGTSTFGAASTGGFGSNNNNNTGSSLFGANKTTASPFGGNTASTGTGLFGGNNNASAGGGFGGFGSSNNATTTNAFGGSGATGGGFSFGASANKPAFGAATNTTTTPLFGQGGSGTTGGFGSSTGAFGAQGAGTALNQPVPPCEGTASTPFAPTSDKEANGVTNNYQSITFQQPYQKYSFEELRLADYNAGRRYGNGSGQAGAFGSSSFGGFGTNNTTGGFGNATNTNTNPFGAATTTAPTGFGSGTTTTGFGGGGLFGNNAAKPATGLFGQTSSSGTTGGLFGSTANNASTGAFGGGSTGGFGAAANTGSSLFGNNNNNQQKPGGLFGSTNNTTSTNTFGFGNNNNQATSNPGTGLFGSTNTTNTGGGLFGNNNNNQQQQNSSGGLFGANNATQQKPGGLFGGTGAFGSQTTQNQPSTGLFGSTSNTNNTAGGLFGNTNNQQQSTGGGLFGQNNNASSGGLFGSNNNNTNNAGGGLFGSTQTQNKPAGGLFGSTANSGGLFGNNNSQQTNSGGLFGNTNTATGGGLFGSTNNQQQKPGGLFGNTSTNQQSGGLFGSPNNGSSLFGASQGQQGQQQQENFKHASLLDPNPYGQSSIWTGLPAPTPENAKPVFTPLTATQKMKESMMKPPPSLRLNQSRYMTPPKGRSAFGFSYSTYGTPNSAASTPGGVSLSGSMYGNRSFTGGSFGRSFSKSASVQNLRAQYASDSDDIWKPGAFASAHRNSSGSIKRLTIDRTIRNDLFSRPSQPALPVPEKAPSTNGTSTNSQTQNNSQPDSSNKLKKRVSFENNTTSGQLNAQTGALVRTETDDNESEPTQETRAANGSGSSSRNNELAVVPEDRESNDVTPRPSAPAQSKADPQPGEYWMKPSRTEMSKMSRETLQRHKDFQVGRQGCGQVTFNGNVDLTAIALDDLYHKIVEIRLRSVTVYPDASMKPPVGKGLNVPSTIAIENSWPRSRNQPSSATSGPVFDKHIDRLKRIPGTDFVNYEVDSGVWTFRVPHYTRYGLDYDDDEDDDMSELTAPPDTIEKSGAEDSVMEVDGDGFDDSNDDNDTFAFKQKTVPGGFGKQSTIDYEPQSPMSDLPDDSEGSERSAYSEEEMSEDEPSMVGSFPNPAQLTFDSPIKSILRAPGTPGKPLLDLDGDWADQLQRTISPRKQNRDVLREAQSKVLLDRAYSPIKPNRTEQTNFRTSVDVMSSIFGKHEESRMSARKQMKDGTDFEFPYAKRAKTFDADAQDLSDADKSWHETFPARFTPTGELLFRKNGEFTRGDGWSDEVVMEQGDDLVIKSKLAHNESSINLASALSSTEITLQGVIPFATPVQLPFSELGEQVAKGSSGKHTKGVDIYTLAHILFDSYDDSYLVDLPSSQAERTSLLPFVQRDRLTDFLSAQIHRDHRDKIAKVEKENPTAAAVLKLTARDIKGACDSLEKIGNYRLMLLVSQLEDVSIEWQNQISAQLDAWREQNVLSEMSDDVRALYEICAGNVTICQGKGTKGVPVEDKAKTFSISEEFGLSWLQAFSLGLWFGRDEKANAKNARYGIKIEDAVREFGERCERGEENHKPGDDPMWVLLQAYTAQRGVQEIEMPTIPSALEQLNRPWDAREAFTLHHAIASCVDGVHVDDDKADELAASLAWQCSAKSDLAGAVYALLYIKDATKRQQLIQTLLDRFAAALPEPTNQSDSTSDLHNASLWTVLTQHLKVPESWLYTAKALHARSISQDSHAELQFLVAAESWSAAHTCLTQRVAPSCIVDEDYATLGDITSIFGSDADRKVQHWAEGGGLYADFVTLTANTSGKPDANLVDSVRRRLVDLGRKLKIGGRGNAAQSLDLGKLSIEELEERVAVREMARVVAGFLSDKKQILELPITSDQRIAHTTAMVG